MTRRSPRRWPSWRAQVAAAGMMAALVIGCARTGRLTFVPVPLAPTTTHAAGDTAEPEGPAQPGRLYPLFGDTLIGLKPGTADSSRRYLGRLRDGYAADTLNLMVFGDNRPGWRSMRLEKEYHAMGGILSFNPVRIIQGLVAIPVALVKGLYPDLALIRDIPDAVQNNPSWGREKEVLSAMLEKIDSLNVRGHKVTAVINTGDLVKDGRYPAHWERFLRITWPLYSRVPYFPVAGNHERTDTVDGVENWRTATGLPVGGDRLYYCFDSADGWLRFIALDSNPIVDPGSHWSREVQIKYSNEQFSWLVDRVREHVGPVLVMMHHPPFSTGYHRPEWQADSVLIERRERMVRALHTAGSSMIISGHEHGYQRALLTWPDDVLITIVAGGAGSPLHRIPPIAQSAQMFAEYKVAGSRIKPENVFTAQAFNFVHMRLWFGGADFTAYAVDEKSKATAIDKVEIDLGRFGIPKIDQRKIPIPPAKGPTAGKAGEKTEEDLAETKPGKVDTTTASKRILTQPPPAKKPGGR